MNPTLTLLVEGMTWAVEGMTWAVEGMTWAVEGLTWAVEGMTLWVKAQDWGRGVVFAVLGKLEVLCKNHDAPCLEVLFIVDSSCGIWVLDDEVGWRDFCGF